MYSRYSDFGQCSEIAPRRLRVRSNALRKSVLSVSRPAFQNCTTFQRYESSASRRGRAGSAPRVRRAETRSRPARAPISLSLQLLERRKKKRPKNEEETARTQKSDAHARFTEKRDTWQKESRKEPISWAKCVVSYNARRRGERLSTACSKRRRSPPGPAGKPRKNQIHLGNDIDRLEWKESRVPTARASFFERISRGDLVLHVCTFKILSQDGQLF